FRVSIPDLRSRLRRELSADQIAQPNPDAVLPVVKALKPSLLIHLLLRHPDGSEAMHVRQLFKELGSVLHPVNAELHCLDVMRVESDLRLLARLKGLVRANGEINLPVLSPARYCR